MANKIPLAEMLDEARAEYARRCQAYPLLIARGQMRPEAAQFKMDRMAAIHNTLAWILRNADDIKAWVEHAKQSYPLEDRVATEMDAPPDVLQEEFYEDQETELHPVGDKTSGGVGVSTATRAA